MPSTVFCEVLVGLPIKLRQSDWLCLDHFTKHSQSDSSGILNSLTLGPKNVLKGLICAFALLPWPQDLPFLLPFLKRSYSAFLWFYELPYPLSKSLFSNLTYLVFICCLQLRNPSWYPEESRRCPVSHNCLCSACLGLQKEAWDHSCCPIMAIWGSAQAPMPICGNCLWEFLPLSCPVVKL